MPDRFNCATCGHRIHHHTRNMWPNFSKGCDDCDCGAYVPKYKTPKEHTDGF